MLIMLKHESKQQGGALEGGDGLSPLGSSFKGTKQRKSKFLAGNNFEFDRTRRIFVILSTLQALRKEGSLVSSLSLCNIFLDVSFVEKKAFNRKQFDF